MGKYSQLSKYKRRQIVKSIFIKTDEIQNIWDTIDKCRDRAKDEPEPRCFLITGDSGRGKSTGLKRYRHKNRPTGKTGQIVRKVVYVETPKNCSLKTLARHILKALEIPDWDTKKGDRDTLFDYVYTQIELQGVEVIIIDEIQHITETGADRTLRKAGDEFKRLAKDKTTPLVMAGLRNSIDLLMENEQLDRLCCYRREIEGFDFKTPEGQKVFCGVLKYVDEQLPFDEIAKIGQSKFARKIFKATGGLMSFVMVLIREAAFEAIKNEEQLVEKHFHYAFDDVMKEHMAGTINPFSKD